MTAVLVRLPLKTRNPDQSSGFGMTRGAAMAKASRRKRERETARLMVIARRGAVDFPGEPYLVTLTRVSAGRLDRYNLGGTLKSVIDGVADALGIDDREEDRLLFELRQRKGPKGFHQVEVLIDTRRTR